MEGLPYSSVSGDPGLTKRSAYDGSSSSAEMIGSGALSPSSISSSSARVPRLGMGNVSGGGSESGSLLCHVAVSSTSASRPRDSSAGRRRTAVRSKTRASVRRTSCAPFGSESYGNVRR